MFFVSFSIFFIILRKLCIFVKLTQIFFNMAKLKNIIKQLSQQDFDKIYQQLMDSSAEKSAYLLKYMYHEQLSDNKIMKELNVNNNAYYTLRSRLNQKIEEYLLEQIESPRSEVLRKVANINEILFTKKRTIAITTLRKLEKELLDYDLSNELVVVYKTLKKLHVNTPEYFEYSQLYNHHVTYMLDVDRLESFMADYFRKYGTYSFSNDETDKLELILLNKEILALCKKYESHRLYVYQNCVNIFHRLFVETEEEEHQQLHDESLEPIEDIFDKIDGIFEQYKLDTIYFHLQIVFEHLRLEYYNHYKLYRKAEKYYEEVNDSASALLSSYSTHAYPARFLLTKLERDMRMGALETMYEDNLGIFHDFEPDPQNIPQFVTYTCYRAIGAYYAEKYDEAIRGLNKVLNDTSLKKFPQVSLEIKLLLGILYSITGETELFGQLISSTQRHIRMLSKDSSAHAILLIKILRSATHATKGDKNPRFQTLMEKVKKSIKGNEFNLTRYIRLDDDFLNRIIK